MNRFTAGSRNSTRAARAALLALALAASMHAIPAAQQSPHGGSAVKPQPGPNVNAVGGIPTDPNDPSALVKSDILLQRQNETVVAASVRNPDHILAAANDYRFVDFPVDEHFGGQGIFSRLLARLVRPWVARPAPARAAAAIGAWTGVYRSCDRGASWIGSAVPGGPLDNSQASLNSPLKAFSNAAAAQGGHAETTDPVLVAGPDGRMHLVVLAFVRFPTGVGESRIYHVTYSDRNNREGGTCFHYNSATEVDRSTAYIAANAPVPFLDKQSVAVDKDGLIVISYTVFLDSVRSKIVVARSTNRGQTWSKVMPFLQAGILRNHGTSTTIDPVRGTIAVAWRLFYQDWPLMVVSRSFDRGRTFWPATPISHWWPSRSLDQIIAQLKAAKLKPFDQFTSEPGTPGHPTARALAFPHITAGVVNGQTRLFAVWQERVDVDRLSPTFGLPLGTGSPRIVFTMSTDGGWSWTQRRALDAGPRTEHPIHPSMAAIEPARVTTRPSGPQIQPVVNISGTTNPQLLVLYYEDAQELDWPYDQNFLSGIARKMQVRVARVSPTTGQLLAPSVAVSNFPISANSSPAALVEAAPGMPVGHYQNLMMYGGQRAFTGDYPSLTASSVFEYASSWKWATEPSSLLAFWTDHRDVEFPRTGAPPVPDINGNWAAYTPLKPFTSGLPTPATCTHVAMRNANPYFAEIAGLVAGSPQTFKTLNIQRAFATYAENRTPEDRFFKWTIHDNEAMGFDGSFDQRIPGDPSGADVDVVVDRIFSHSSRARTVWVEPFLSNLTASLRITIEETTDATGAVLKANGYRARIILNPDPNNNALDVPPPLAPGFENVIGETSEIHNPQVSAPQVSAFRVSAPQVSAPQVSAPQVSAPQVSAPQVSAPQVSAPQVSAPQVSAPQVSAIGPGETNGTDVTFSVTNDGNTSTVYNAFLNVPGVEALLNSGLYDFQLLITRTSLVPTFVQTAAGCIPAAAPQVQVLANLQVPQVSAPQVSAINNPQVSAPQVSANSLATFALAPESGVEGQGSHGDDNNEDAHSFPLVPRIDVTVRAIRLRDPIPGDPIFDPNAVVLRVQSTSTNVVNGVIQAEGTQPGSFTQPDFAILEYTPSPTPLVAAAGGEVTLSPWTLTNQGTAASTFFEGSGAIAYAISDDPVITNDDLVIGTDSFGTMAVGAQVEFAARTLTIPATLEPGSYYIGFVVDRFNNVGELIETNNYASEPITITGAVACLAPPANLIGWWPGDGNFRDIQGGRDGQDGSEGGVEFEDGKVGQAFTFRSDYGAFVRIEDETDALTPAQLTVDFWFKSDELLNDNTLVAPLLVKQNFEDDAAASSNGYDFFYQGSAIRFGLRRSDGVRVIALRSGDIAADEWHHVTGTFDGRYQRLYFDGELADTVDWLTMGTPTYVENTEIRLGRIQSTAFSEVLTDYYFLGQIDEVEIFGRALSASEIEDLYNSNGKCRPIVLVADQAVAVVGQPLTLTALVVPPPTQAGAMVEFRDGESVLATQPVNAAGVATLTTSSLSFAVHSLTARAAGTLTGAQPSSPLTQHMVARYNTLTDFNAAIAGSETFSQNFNGLPVGTSFKHPTTTLISGVLDVSSAFSFSTGHHLEVYPFGEAERVLFGFVDAEAFNPRTYAFGGFAYYYAYFGSPSTFNAMAFTIVGQDPNSTPALVNVFTPIGTAVLAVSNTSGNELLSTFIGMVSTLPMDGVYVTEGCEGVTNPCLNEEIAIDNFVVARPIY